MGKRKSSPRLQQHCNNAASFIMTKTVQNIHDRLNSKILLFIDIPFFK
ncbi:hypothetical protein [Alkalihalobacillus trypoxylicola]|nr:hypothetical protein [Alkalihalobacillus trypoxylicola]